MDGYALCDHSYRQTFSEAGRLALIFLGAVSGFDEAILSQQPFLFILWFVGGSRRLLGTAHHIVFILRLQINYFRIYGFALHTK